MVPFGRPISELNGKVVWITGASSGIGEALAYLLASHGVKLVISGTNESRLRLHFFVTEANQTPVNLLLLQNYNSKDIKDFSVHEKQFNAVIKHFQRLDILVSNAGRSQRASFETIDIEVDKEMFDVNVFGLINLTRIVLRYFLDNQMKGHFAVTSSTAGKLGVPNSGSYTASKHALHGYYECLRVEAQSRGISITMLCPGPVFSRVLENAMSNKLDSSHEVEVMTKFEEELGSDMRDDRHERAVQ
ncbi:unnamed protein product [Medioppia subpectinata]|uniref:Uncharacterized protein n=1 Tax=Medioppia subpectinata TaxID=1979941 RepID=A0A7R9KPZ1_9ACAR|nr:unnamed protein product [Medioppia subpectinata]CAG2106508.1 unnamed protein product [Medioppia subpectinata]